MQSVITPSSRKKKLGGLSSKISESEYFVKNPKSVNRIFNINQWPLLSLFAVYYISSGDNPIWLLTLFKTLLGDSRHVEFYVLMIPYNKKVLEENHACYFYPNIVTQERKFGHLLPTWITSRTSLDNNKPSNKSSKDPREEERRTFLICHHPPILAGKRNSNLRQHLIVVLSREADVKLASRSSTWSCI